MTQRISRDEWLQAFTNLTALRGTCSRAMVGAIIVRDRRVISTGYNGAPSNMPHCIHTGEELPEGCREVVHAEANAIVFAAKYGIATEGTELWCTHEPCLECAKLIINAGIKRVHYLEHYARNSGVELMDNAGLEVIYHGVEG